MEKLKCNECGADMHLDAHFRGRRDNFWVCTKCATDCVQEIRYGKPNKERWRTENNGDYREYTRYAEGKMRKIIAVDFDGTLCKNEFPGIGEPRLDIIERLLAEKRAGAKIILWTCRIGERLKEAVDWCEKQGIVFDAVNESLPESIAGWKTNPRKICATEYWDDRAVKC